MGAVHARTPYELASETNDCRLAALADSDINRALQRGGGIGTKAEIFHPSLT